MQKIIKTMLFTLLVMQIFLISAQAKTVTVKFLSPTGTEYKNLRKKVSTTTELKIPDIPRKNHPWAGWTTTKGQKFADYTGGEKIKFTKNTALYAVSWNDKTLNVNQIKIYKSACSMNRIMKEMQKAKPRTWYYRNGMGSKTFKKAIAEKKTWCDCYHCVWWVVANAGFTRTQAYTKVSINGAKTARQLINSGKFLPGDYVNYDDRDAEHVNMYLGNGVWFDAGRVYMPYGSNPPFIKWIGEDCFSWCRVEGLFQLKRTNTAYKPIS